MTSLKNESGAGSDGDTGWGEGMRVKLDEELEEGHWYYERGTGSGPGIGSLKKRL